jgi:hypothetical protein
MKAHVDFVTLTLDFDVDGDKLLKIMPEVRLAQSGMCLSEFQCLISHEWSHMLSFLGATISDLHRLIVLSQCRVMKQLLCWHKIEASNNVLQVPIFDESGELSPNICEELPLAKMERITLHLLEQLKVFYFGHVPNIGINGMLSGQELLNLVAAANPEVQAAFILPVDAPLDLEEMELPQAAFINEGRLEWVRPDFPNWEKQEYSLPVLPYWSNQRADKEKTLVISSKSVLEGLAIAAELLASYSGDKLATLGVRQSVPFPYTSALRYALHCINSANNLTYTYEDLMCRKTPIEIVVTILAMLDLALQVTLLSIRNMDCAMVDLCPAWRLYFIGKFVSEQRMKVLEGVTPDGRSRFFHDWQDEVLTEIWAWSQEAGAIVCLDQYMELKRRDPRTLEPGEIFNYLRTMARTMRMRSEIAYIQQEINLREREWLDFVGFRSSDGSFIPSMSNDSCFIFFYKWYRDFYRLAACLDGKYWDKWWTDFEKGSFSEVQDRILRTLGEAMVDFAEDHGPELIKWIDLPSYTVQVRPEYDWGWKR